MKVLFITRNTLFTAYGGDTVQITQTAHYLRKEAISVDIRLTAEPIEYEEYDLIHIFNMVRPADLLFHIVRTSRPIVLSPIFVNYNEYDREHRRGLSGILFRYLPSTANEYFKTIARWLIGKDQLKSKSYLWKGQHRSIRQILDRVNLILPNSRLEQEQINNRHKSSFRHEIVPNGIDNELFLLNSETPRDKNLVICAARIEGLKNQYSLIKALNNTAYQLIVIGAPAPNQHHYYKKCRQAAASNVLFLDHVSQEQLVHYYQKAKVHVLPSWFETCGLSSLEAGVMGCNIVVTDKGYTREYFEDYAFYCDPASHSSIREAIEKAAQAPFPEELRKKILINYTWQKAAEKTLAAYKKVLGKL